MFECLHAQGGVGHCLGFLKNPYLNFKYLGDFSLQDFFLDGQEVGNLLIQTDWSDSRKSILLNGLLDYRNQPTLDFGGVYFTNTNQLDLNLKFKNLNFSKIKKYFKKSVL